jgi:hypothetical protein
MAIMVQPHCRQNRASRNRVSEVDIYGVLQKAEIALSGQKN